VAATPDVESAFRDACLASTIAERHLPVWASAHATELSLEALPHAVTDQAIRAWRVNGTIQPVYVLLSKQWECIVWAKVEDPAPYVQRFRRWIQAEDRANKDPTTKLTLFKDGEIVPGHLAALCYVLEFGVDPIGLMWCARVTGDRGALYLSLVSGRIRVGPRPASSPR